MRLLSFGRLSGPLSLSFSWLRRPGRPSRRQSPPPCRRRGRGTGPSRLGHDKVPRPCHQVLAALDGRTTTDRSAAPHDGRMGARTLLLRTARGIVLLSLLGIAAACASIPKEAPELSAALGQRLNDIEAAHLALLQTYFDERRDRVDEFVTREWVPVFAREVFGQPHISQVWDAVVASDDPNDRLQFILILGPEIQQRINRKREELHNPLNEVERALDRRLRDEYVQVKAMNNSITAFLVSANKVDEVRARYLEMFDLSDNTLASAVDEMDEAVNRLLEAGQAGESLASRGEAFAAQLKGVADRIASGGANH